MPVIPWSRCDRGEGTAVQSWRSLFPPYWWPGRTCPSLKKQHKDFVLVGLLVSKCTNIGKLRCNWWLSKYWDRVEFYWTHVVVVRQTFVGPGLNVCPLPEARVGGCGATLKDGVSIISWVGPFLPQDLHRQTGTHTHGRKLRDTHTQGES